MTKKKTTLSEEDQLALQQAMQGVKPLKNNPLRVRKAPTRPRYVARRQEPDDDSDLSLTEALALPAVTSEEYIQYKQASVSHKILRNLRKGQYNVEAKLDLHGMSVEEALHAVDRFLKQCLQEGIRVALIIHGKGHASQTPILKNKLNHWLRGFQPVLAYCSAAPFHGSRGAVYVLLKRNSEER